MTALPGRAVLRGCDHAAAQDVILPETGPSGVCVCVRLCVCGGRGRDLACRDVSSAVAESRGTCSLLAHGGSGDVNGYVTGDVTGDVTEDVTEDVTGGVA